jgi:probable HAF family extracellular repeat protein
MRGSWKRVSVTVALVGGALAPQELAAAHAGQEAPGPATIAVTYLTTQDGMALLAEPAAGINDRGEVLAFLADEGLPDNSPYDGAVRRRGAVTRFPETAYGADLSEQGEVVGYHVQPSAENVVPFSWSRRRGLSHLPTRQPFSTALAVNDRGQVLGQQSTSIGIGGRGQAVAWDRGRLIEPPAGSSPRLLPFSGKDLLNDRGQAAVEIVARTPGGSRSRAAIWQIGGEVVELGTLGGDHSYAAAINEAGDVVGMSRTETGEDHAFLWRDGEMIDLGTLGGSYSWALAINERGDVTGVSSTADGEMHAFLWRDGEMTQLPSLAGPGRPADTFPNDINDRGQIVGRSSTPDGNRHAVVWQHGRAIDLGALVDGDNSEADEINDRGQIVGGVFDGGFEDPRQSRAVMWTIRPRR